MVAAGERNHFVARTHLNRLIAVLPPADRRRLLKAVDPLSMTARQRLDEAGDPMKYVYFPVSGVHSIVSTLTDGGIIDVATVGNEGMIGIPVFLGGRSTRGKAFCHVPGDVLRMRAAHFREEVRRSRPLRTVMLRYTLAFIEQLAQHAACTRLHSIVERCASSLLMTRDRMSADEFLLTQELLAHMLGVRRATVTTAAGMLQHAGVIEYARGRITIVNQKKLERVSCRCYRIVRQEYKRLLN